MTLDPKHVDWSRNHFARMSDGGAWAIPRSGLIFNKRGNSLVLVALMPHDSKMPINAEQLRSQQEADYRIVREHFGAAGIDVVRSC